MTRIFHNTHQEVLVTEDGKMEHICDTWSQEYAELIAQLLNEYEKTKWR
jgi:hypothetical protein